MATSMKDFINLYFRQLHFDAMPEASKTQFDTYVTNNDFRGHMKNWVNDLLAKDAAGKPFRLTNAQGKPVGHYVHNNLPDFNTITDDEEWAELYLELYNTFVKMNSNRENLNRDDDDKKAIPFLDKYSGIFPPQALDISTKAEINKLLGVLESHSNIYALVGLDSKDVKTLRELKNNPSKLDEPETRLFLTKIVGSIYRALSSQWDDEYNDERNALRAVDLAGLYGALYKDRDVTPADIQALKAKLPEILKTLHDDKKVFNAFKKNNDGYIPAMLEDAIAKTDYTGKITEKDVVAPKRNDKKTFGQKISDGIKDTYNDTLKKYVTAHRDHIYVKPSAKIIVEAFDKEKIKPTDGIKAMLDKESAITNSIKDKSPTASAHFEWFVKTMKELQTTMPKAFEGALRNGRQMHALVEEMAEKAIEDNKIEEAKTAMEVLSVMRYGLFTSRTMDAINKTDFTIFSDDGLSWNKNEYIKPISKAFDKTIKLGIQVAGYAATGVVNGLRRIGTRFNHSGKMQNKSDEWAAKNQHDKDNFLNNYVTPQNNADRQEITNQQAIMQTLAGRLGLNQNTTLDQRKTDLRNGRAQEERLATNVRTMEQNIEPLVAQERDYADFIDKQNKQQEINREINRLKAQLQAMPVNPADPLQAHQTNTLDQQLTAKEQEFKDISAEIKNINDKYSATNGIVLTFNQAAQQRLANGRAVIQNTNQHLNTEKNRNDALANDIDEYERAQSVIDTCRDSINKRNQEYNEWDDKHKNKYVELMGFWDFLQTGHPKNIFRFSTKRLQKKMDKGKMDQIYQDWITDHSYAA